MRGLKSTWARSKKEYAKLRWTFLDEKCDALAVAALSMMVELSHVGLDLTLKRRPISSDKL